MRYALIGTLLLVTLLMSLGELNRAWLHTDVTVVTPRGTDHYARAKFWYGFSFHTLYVQEDGSKVIHSYPNYDSLSFSTPPQ